MHAVASGRKRKFALRESLERFGQRYAAALVFYFIRHIPSLVMGHLVAPEHLALGLSFLSVKVTDARALPTGRENSQPRMIDSQGPSCHIAADFSVRGCPHCIKLCTAHYFSMRNLRLSKNFQPFGRHAAVRQIEPKMQLTAPKRSTPPHH